MKRVNLRMYYFEWLNLLSQMQWTGCPENNVLQTGGICWNLMVPTREFILVSCPRIVYICQMSPERRKTYMGSRKSWQTIFYSNNVTSLTSSSLELEPEREMRDVSWSQFDRSQQKWKYKCLTKAQKQIATAGIRWLVSVSSFLRDSMYQISSWAVSCQLMHTINDRICSRAWGLKITHRMSQYVLFICKVISIYCSGCVLCPP